MRKVINKEKAGKLIGGSSLGGYIEGFTYEELVDLMGEPTFNEEDGGDGKINKEWTIIHYGNVYTIYDWKTYDTNYTMTKLKKWNIGGKANCADFINELTQKLENNRKEYYTF